MIGNNCRRSVLGISRNISIDKYKILYFMRVFSHQYLFVHIQCLFIYLCCFLGVQKWAFFVYYIPIFLFLVYAFNWIWCPIESDVALFDFISNLKPISLLYDVFNKLPIVIQCNESLIFFGILLLFKLHIDKHLIRKIYLIAEIHKLLNFSHIQNVRV